MAVKELFLLIFLAVHVSCEKNSLTFVIDDTSSMWDDIRQVKSASKSIIDIVVNEKSTQIHDIVLVTFNDPDIHFRKRTRDEKELKNALDSIKERGGDDCPEMALKGIKKALMESQQGSYLFVFSDASAKDYRQFKEIRSLAQEKQSQIVFILTGDCLDTNRESYQVYHKIAKDSNGQVFRINKNEIGQVLEYVKETIRGDRTVITSVIVPAHNWRAIQFNVDDQTEYAIVSASGANVQMQIRDPNNRLMTHNKYITLTQNVKVMKLSNLVPGTYTVYVKGNSEVNIMIFGRTDFTFEHGFSEQKESSLRTTVTQPTIGVKSHLMIAVKDPENSVNVKSLQILDMKENVIMKLSLTHVHDNIYATEKFKSPEQNFKIAVIATSRKTGKDIRRIGKTPVKPVKPIEEAPEISKTDKYFKVKEGESIDLPCRVRGQPKPTIKWYLKQQDSAHFQELNGENDAILHVRNAMYNDYYKCQATNKVGSDEHTLQLDVQARPEFLNTPNVITKNEGESVTIDCRLRRGNPRPKAIGWQFKRLGWSQFRHYEHAAEKLAIPAAQPEYAGEYQCSAKNEWGHREKVTTLIIQGKPVIEIAKPIIEAMEHTTVTLQCRVTRGFPIPTIDWYYEGPSDANKKISTGSEEIQLKNIQLHNAGHYRCVVKNTLGSTQGRVQVIVNAPPRILSETTHYDGVEGDVVMKLPCVAVGHPTPTIIWEVDNVAVGSDKSEEMYIEDNALFLKNPMEKHSTYAGHTYVCKARNNMDTAVQTCNVTITKHPDLGETDVTFSVHKQPYDVRCPLPYTDPNSVRWFKVNSNIDYIDDDNDEDDDYDDDTNDDVDNEYKDEQYQNIENSVNLHKTGPTLHIENPTHTDNGNYTCRVSDLKGATTHNVEVFFGYPPTRDENLLSFNLTWQGDSSETIDCSSDQDPEGTYTWFYNGEKLEGQNYHSLHLAGWGHYTCIVSNPLGSLVINFEVTGKDCGIPTSLFKTKHTPIILDSSLNWPSLKNGGQYIIVPNSEKLTLFCQVKASGKSNTSFRKFPNSKSVVATCDHEESFLVDGSLMKFSELDCKNNVEYRLHDTTKACLGKNTKLYKIGYNTESLQDYERFITVYESCVDTIKNVPLYTKIKTIPVEATGEDNIRSGKDTCVDNSKCCYESIQLVNEKDVSFGPPQKATHIDSFNSVKYCKPKNLTSWHDIETLSRSEFQFVVWSGAAKYEKIGTTWAPKRK